jgi:hypothetical protein
MNKHNVAAVLWFLAGWSGGGLLTIFGLPTIAAFVPGIVLGGLVLWDPAHWFSARRPADRRVIRSINVVAAELDRKVERWSGAEVDHRRL